MTDKIQRLLKNRQNNYIFPFLWMHGESEETLREYMGAIGGVGIGAVCVESRPHPDFMGEKWWKDMDVILDEAKKRRMKVWILDDSHFPTGYANGALEHADEKRCRQSLAYRVIDCPEPGQRMSFSAGQYEKPDDWVPNLNESYTMNLEQVRRFEDDRFLGAVALRTGGESLEEMQEILPEGEEKLLNFTVPAGRGKIYFLYLTRNRGPHRNYINMLSPASCRILLDTVYEPHFAHYAEDFGTTIAGFFSDEPELGNGHLYESGKRIFEMDDQAWSRELEDALRGKWGKDFLKYLSLLWEQDFSDSLKAKARFDYMDTVTRKVEEAFSLQIGEWCHAHGVEYIGHLIEDNNQHTRTGSSLGHYFRGLAGQDMAGIDDIGGQVLPQGEWNGPCGIIGEIRNGEFYHFVLGRLAASLAAIDPKKKNRSLCEIFGNYGWEEGVRLEKYLLDHFLVRGINHFVPHAFSPKEYPDPDCPPHFYAHGHNPQYRHFGELMRYANRVCTLLDGGKHVSPVAILYNAEAEWTGDYMDLEKPARLLAQRQIEYDFIPADVFADREYFGTEIGNRLRINGREYKILLIPRAQFISSVLAEALEAMGQERFPVIFIDALPEGICGEILPPEGACGEMLLPERTCAEMLPLEGGEKVWGLKNQTGTEVCPLANLPQMLEDYGIPEVVLNPACSGIRCLRYAADREIYFFVNEGVECYTGQVRVPARGKNYRYDAWNNTIAAAASAECEEGTWLSLKIEPLKSCIIVFDDPEEEPSKIYQIVRQEPQEDWIRKPWNEGWTRTFCSAEAYPDFQSARQIALPDHMETEYPEFSGFIKYEKELFCETGEGELILEVTDAYEGVEVFVNDVSLGIQIAPPFSYCLTGRLRRGNNAVRIEVATTLERENAKLPDPIRMYMGLGEKIPECPSGINGTVSLYYAEEEG